MDQFTFGKTPAAQYLVRELNDIQDFALTKSCSVRNTQFNRNVSDILLSVDQDVMGSKVAANLLRLLRSEAKAVDVGHDFINQLLRNVIIGRIKQAIRKVTTLRKVEVNNINLNKVRRKSSVVDGDQFSEYHILGHLAGVEYRDGSYYRQCPSVSDIEDPITPELLEERSIKRCTRLNKVHNKTI